MAVAEFERGIIKERVNAGIAAAKSRGIRFGRPRKHTWNVAHLKNLRKQGLGIRAIGRELQMPASTVSTMLQQKRKIAKQ
jgi:DNA invertase Pin-like site-specific DNA recombinase